MPRSFNIVEQFVSGDDTRHLFDFNSIEEAARYMHGAHFDDEFGVVLEVETLALGVSRGHDRREDFEKAWMQIEAEKHSLTSPFDLGSLRHDYWIENKSQGPNWRGVKYPEPTLHRMHGLEAAE